MSLWLAPLFAVVALIYASVGFAGGSTYTALLVLAGVALPLVPLVSLACNIVVASGGVVHFQREGHIAWRRVAPLLLVSVPLAWFGGSLPVAPALFVPLLGWSLVAAGALLMLGPDRQATRAPVDPMAGPGLVPLMLAAPLGLLSGVVGIGGGIFLAPLLHLMGWDSARRIAGAAAIFILANSLAGIAGQAGKLGNAALLDDVLAFWPLVIAVLAGGQLGSLLGSRRLPLPLIRRLTGLVVLVAAIRLLTA